MSLKKNKKPWNVFIAIFLAFIVGNLTGTQAEIFGISYYSIFDLLGTIFIHALTMIVVPLVLSSIISGISRIGSDSSFKKIGLKTLGFYMITSVSAVLIGLLCVQIFQPGHSESLRQSLESVNSSHIEAHVQAHESMGISHLLLSIVPSNILAALSQGNMLGLIFFGILFGYALSKVPSSKSQTLQCFFQELFETMIQVTHIVMKCLPIGVFCLVATVAATTGYKSLASLGMFFITVLVGLLLFSLVLLPLFLKYIGKVHPLTHFKAMAPALVTAFSTSSSSATLPITMECIEKRAGVSNRICSLVVPLGNSLNMAGSALYECIGALFIAQVYGIELTFSAQIIFVLLALVTSMGVAGIPAASLVAIVVILKAFGLPPEGIALFMAVDRILDMCRTTVNVLSDSCCAVLVAKSEGETQILTRKNFNEP